MSKNMISGKWSDKELAQFSQLVKTHRDEEIAEIMNRSVDSIRGQRNMQGIATANPQLKMWTESEIAQVKDLASTGKSNQEIAEIMGRTRRAVQQLKFRLGLGDFTTRKWTDDEVKQLKLLAKTHTTAELAQILDREWTAVGRKCKSLGITTQSKHIEMHTFTAEEDEFIIKFERSMTNAQLAQRLGRSEGSVKGHKSRLRKKGLLPPYIQ